MKKRIALTGILLLSGGLLYTLWDQYTTREAIEIEIASLYDHELGIKEEIFSYDVHRIQEKSKKLFSKQQRDQFEKELMPIECFTLLKEKLQGCFDGDVLKSDVTDEDITQLQESYQRLPDAYQKQLKTKLTEAISQKKMIREVIGEIEALFQDGDIVLMRDGVTWSEYQEVKAHVDQLAQNDIKQAYAKKLSYVESSLLLMDDQNPKEESHKTGIHMIEQVPIVNQLDEKVYSGCEAASLLMGLQYRGYLLDMTLPEFALLVPKSNDPHMGFVSNIFTYEPRDVVHWIAPNALAAFGKTYYDGVEDISGADPEQLKAEIDKGNPVIVYGTDMYREPTAWIDGIQLNMHVQLLVGYDADSGDYILHDPGYNEISFSKQQFESIYNVNKYAVVIR